MREGQIHGRLPGELSGSVYPARPVECLQGDPFPERPAPVSSAQRCPVVQDRKISFKYFCVRLEGVVRLSKHPTIFNAVCVHVQPLFDL